MKCSTRTCQSEAKPSIILRHWWYCSVCRTFQKPRSSQSVEKDQEKPMEEAEEILCTDHPKYRALRRPRSGCKKCYSVYAEKWPERIPEG